MVFSKEICGSFKIDLFVNSNTCKGKITYTQISPDLVKTGLHRVMLLQQSNTMILLCLLGLEMPPPHEHQELTIISEQNQQNLLNISLNIA